MSEKSDVKFQFVACFCVNIISISYGAFCGWPSASFLELQSPESPLESGPMSNEEAGFVGSMLCVGGIMGTICFAWCAEQIGRKRSLLLTALPALLGWLIIPFAQSPWHLSLSRFFGGFCGGGIFVVVPIYVTELAEDHIRGMLGSFLVFSCNIGVLSAFVLGYFLPYNTVAWIIGTLPLVFFVCFAFLPETPQHLLKRNKVIKAEKALRYFRNLRRFSIDLPGHLQNEFDKLKITDKEQYKADSKITWQDFNNHTARRALVIGIGLMALNQFCGLFAMLNYTSIIFQQSGSHLSPNASAIIVGSIQMIGTVCSSFLVERAGRKLLLMISAAGTGLSLACWGFYSQAKEIGYDTQAFDWVPVASFSFSLFIACWGILTLPFVVVSEIMPPKIRNVGSMICMIILLSFAFFMLKYLPVMMGVLGINGLMFTFSTCSFIGTIFVGLYVPETKGKSIDEILLSL